MPRVLGSGGQEIGKGKFQTREACVWSVLIPHHLTFPTDLGSGHSQGRKDAKVLLSVCLLVFFLCLCFGYSQSRCGSVSVADPGGSGERIVF